MTTSPKTTKDEVLKLALNELEELTSVAAQCDSWQSFPYEPLEKAYATITAIREALAQPAADDKAVQRMVHDFPALSAFHEKYALGPMAKPSCLCCGHVPEEVAIKHMELPGIVICKKCRDAALLADDKAGWEVAAWQERQEQAPGEFTVWYSCKAPSRRATVDGEHLSLTTGDITYQWRPLYTRPQLQAAQPAERVALTREVIENAYEAGFITCAIEWAGREDLTADVGSLSYKQEMNKSLSAIGLKEQT